MEKIDGKKIREKRAAILREKIEGMSERPHLTIIQIGDRPESDVYIRQKLNFASEIGATATDVRYDERVTTKQLKDFIENLNTDGAMHGIIVQLPVPDTIDLEEVLNTIEARKDVDGLTATNLHRLMVGDERAIVPATAKGILSMIKESGVEVQGKHVVVVGRSLLVGKPTAMLMLKENATVSICHSETQNLKEMTRSADILVVATGKKGLITKDHVKEGQVVIDVGINVEDGKLHGDVDFEEVSGIVKAISPVPGGVGPMTVLSLFENLVEAAQKSSGK